MKVTLIDYTGAGHPDPLYAARKLVYTKNTRLTQGEETRARVAAMSEEEINHELGYIANTIRSSWEFVGFTFEIVGVSRAYTHQQVRTRHASFAQQAQRVVDMSTFETLCPASIAEKPKLAERWKLAMDMIASVYTEFRKEGIPAQDARGVLPTNILTNIIMEIDLRNFADIVGKRENLRAQGEYADVVRQMTDEVLRVMPWARPFLYPDRKAAPAIERILKRLLGDRSPVEVPEINDALKELDKLRATWG